jgi:hypothetical protein
VGSNRDQKQSELPKMLEPHISSLPKVQEEDPDKISLGFPPGTDS